MKPTNLTVKILTEIRDAVRECHVRIDQTNQRLDLTNREMHQGFENLGGYVNALHSKVNEAEIRTATLMVGVSRSMDELRSELIKRHDLYGRMDRCETDIQVLKQRVK